MPGWVNPSWNQDCWEKYKQTQTCRWYHPNDRKSEKAVAPHSSTLAWKIPWTEEPGRLQSMGSLRVSHNWVTSLSLFTSCIREGNGNPLQCSCLENPRDRGAWWAAVYGITQSRTQLKWPSSLAAADMCQKRTRDKNIKEYRQDVDQKM